MKYIIEATKDEKTWVEVIQIEEGQKVREFNNLPIDETLAVKMAKAVRNELYKDGYLSVRLVILI